MELSSISISDVSNLEDELVLIFIGLGSGVSWQILHVAFPHILA